MCIRDRIHAGAVEHGMNRPCRADLLRIGVTDWHATLSTDSRPTRPVTEDACSRTCPDCLGDLGDGLLDRHAVLLRAVAVAEGHRLMGAVLFPRDEHERD